MAKKISVEKIIEEHQLILERGIALFPAVTDVSMFATKGNDTVSYPTLAPAAGELLDLSNGDNITGEDLNFGKDTLTMDKAAARGFPLDANEEEENYMNGLQAGMNTSISAIGRQIDKSIYDALLAAASGNVVPTADIYEDIVDLAALLDAEEVPESDRFLAVSSTDYAKLRKCKDFIRVDARGGEDRISTGFVGNILSFQVIKSNVVTGDSLAFHKAALAIAKHGEMKMKVEEQAYEMSTKHALWQKFGLVATQSGKFIKRLGANA